MIYNIFIYLKPFSNPSGPVRGVVMLKQATPIRIEMCLYKCNQSEAGDRDLL